MKATGRSLRARFAAAAGHAILLACATAWAADPSRAANKATTHATASKPAHPGKTARWSEPAPRRSVGAIPPAAEAAGGVDSPELRTLREAERELFYPSDAERTTPWPPALPKLLPAQNDPLVSASGLPPSVRPPPPIVETTGDWAWLARLQLPDLPVRWDDRIVRYLEFFRDDPRGRVTFASLFRHSGRVRDLVRRAFRQKSLPEDLVWVAMIESGFDPTARSSAGAVGLWQFMPETGREYGLVVDRWVDERMSAALATGAAAELLNDLHQRFGSWELALAAYNMGSAGLSSVLRRYNTNDFWSLSRIEGSLPWETTLYVPKILAAAIIAHNLAEFGFGDVTIDAPVDSDAVDVPPGTTFSVVATAAGCDPKDVEALNPELRVGRTPPATDGQAARAVRVPLGRGSMVERALARLHRDPVPVDRYVVRFGETLEQIAAAHRTTAQRLQELNALLPGEAVHGGTILQVPFVDDTAPATPAAPIPGPPKQSVVVPVQSFQYADRRRVFYRVVASDTLPELAAALHVSVDELRRWNDLDVSAHLEEGMVLQAFVASSVDLSRISCSLEGDVRVIAVGSDDFFAASDQNKGYRRLVLTAKAGDTLESMGKRFGVSARTMERINRRGRNEALRPGDPIVVYAPNRLVPTSAPAAPSPAPLTASNAPVPLGPLPDAPAASLLP